MQVILNYLISFGLIFLVVLLGMLVFMKFARKRVEPTPEEKHASAKYLEGAPPEGSGTGHSNADHSDKG